MLLMPPDREFSAPVLTPLGRLRDFGPEVSLLRLDQLHPEVSGNKWFKLKYNLQDAAAMEKRTILTFGGPWSNHIAATAAMCRLRGLRSIGVIRGEAPAAWSDALLDARARGMELVFVSRARYRQKEDLSFLAELRARYGDVYIVPEGGNNPAGVRGCGEILATVPVASFTHIALAVGTGATFRGVAQSAGKDQRVWGFLALKGAPEVALQEFCNPVGEDGGTGAGTRLITDYTFGGFARTTPELLGFMQDFRKTHGVLLDFVYTAKMMYGITDMIRTGSLGPGDRILAIHTGGLQGNRSLDPALGLMP